jgi:hypothetical protein
MPANRSGKFVSSLAIGPQIAKVIEDIRVSSAAKALGVELGPLVRQRPLSHTWCVRSAAPDAKELAMVTVAEGATTAQRALFSTMAEAIHAAGDSLPGVLRVRAIAPSRDAFLTDLWTAGSARDLSVLRWPPRRRVEFVLRTVRTIEGLHLLGMVHGCLCPGNVLLDDELQPIVAEAGSVPVHAVAKQFGSDAQLYVAFAAPDVVKGEPANAGSDVYSLGRILEDTLKGDPLNAELDEIVRRCTAGLPSVRYSQAGELRNALEAALGLLPAEEPAPRTITSIPALVQPSHRVQKEEPRTRARVSTRPAAWHLPRALGVVGLLAATSAVVASALVGGSNADLRKALAVALVAGVAFATTLVRPPHNAGRGLSQAVQLLLALACTTPLVVLDPLAFTYRLAARRHLRGDAASRRMGIEEIVRLGRDFRGLFLVDADLSGLDLEMADLRGANLSRANLTHTRLVRANVSDTSLDEAALAGADLRQVDLDIAIVREATCDSETRPPDGWLCSEGRLRRKAP